MGITESQKLTLAFLRRKADLGRQPIAATFRSPYLPVRPRSRSRYKPNVPNTIHFHLFQRRTETILAAYGNAVDPV